MPSPIASPLLAAFVQLKAQLSPAHLSLVIAFLTALMSATQADIDALATQTETFDVAESNTAESQQVAS
jgi:hypothetical protein